MKQKPTSRPAPIATEPVTTKKPIEETSKAVTQPNVATAPITGLWLGNWGDAFNDEDDNEAITLEDDVYY